MDEIDTNQITVDPEIYPADDISFQFGSSEESNSQNSISYSQAIKTNKSETLAGVKPRHVKLPEFSRNKMHSENKRYK